MSNAQYIGMMLVIGIWGVAILFAIRAAADDIVRAIKSRK